jgi:KaiC/GvpD/RAD55 family RecA-like ATPase
MVEKARMPESSTKRKKTQAEEIDQLMEYIEQGGSLGLELEKRLEEMPEKYTVLLITRQEKTDLLIANLVKNFTKKGLQGIFVTLNKSARDLIEMLQEHHVESSSLFVIDAISKGNVNEVAVKNITYVDSPQDLTELQAQISDFTEMIDPNKRFLILDSLSTLLIYNAERTVEKFVHSMCEILKAENFKAVFTIMEGVKPETMNVISLFFDKIIKPSPRIKP